MKKFLISILSITLAIALALSAGGCKNVVSLTFNNNFNGGGEAGEPNASYTEELVYDVALTDNYGDGLIKKDPSITDEVIKYRIEDGSFVHRLEVLPFLPDDIQTDINVDNKMIYRITTLLTLNAIYDINDGNGEKIYNDKIETELYFLPSGQSFAPIYSKTVSTSTLVSITNNAENIVIDQQTTESITEYNSETYKVTILFNDQSKVTDHEYDYRTLIDNTQFLFALRGLSVASESYTDINVVSPAYGEAKTLRVTHGGELSTNLKATVNGNEVDQAVAVTNLSYQLNTTRNAGSQKFVLIQSAKSQSVPYLALPIQFAETLSSYGSFMSMGALVYTLKTVTTSTAE